MQSLKSCQWGSGISHDALLSFCRETARENGARETTHVVRCGAITMCTKPIDRLCRNRALFPPVVYAIFEFIHWFYCFICSVFIFNNSIVLLLSQLGFHHICCKATAFLQSSRRFTLKNLCPFPADTIVTGPITQEVTAGVSALRPAVCG